MVNMVQRVSNHGSLVALMIVTLKYNSISGVRQGHDAVSMVLHLSLYISLVQGCGLRPIAYA